MSVAPNAPNTIFLGGERTQINDRTASEAIKPGHLVELFNNAGIIRFRKHSSAGADTARLIATEMAMMNKGVDDAYALADLVEVSAGRGGSTFWMRIASGQNIVAGQKLESAGNGTLRAIASGTALFSSLENSGAVVAETMLRVEVV